jgi:hypothetical protein
MRDGGRHAERVVAKVLGTALVVVLAPGVGSSLAAADPGPASSGPSTVQVPGPVPADPPAVPAALPPAPARSAQATGPADITNDRAMAATPIVRVIGVGESQDVAAAANAEAADRQAGGCSVSSARLQAMLISIPFTEAGPLSSETVAPSPMTLSRFDAQAALWSFGSTSTAFPKAFWHPGIGLWQFDHPWQNTAAERINTAPASVLAADVIAGRWCGWTSATGLSQFAYAVAPWHGCDDTTGAGNRCLAIFNTLFVANGSGIGDDALGQIKVTASVGRLGGAVATHCQLAGEATARTCLFVDPSKAQGSTAWASPAFSSTPVAAPFYVITVGSTEWRYWLRADTGYDRDIVGKATIGSDPRTTLAWAVGGGMCDVGTGKGTCPCGGQCFFLTNALGGGDAGIVFRDPQPADQILVGDWNAAGGDSLGFRKGNQYALKNTLGATPPDITFAYGRPDDTVLVGDWNGDGIDTPAVRRGNFYYFRNAFGGGPADITVAYGKPDDVVLVGDWDGDGKDTLAVRRGSTYFIKNTFSGGPADIVVPYGRAGDAVLVGDWNGDGKDTLMVRRDHTYFVKNSFTGGAADVTFAYGRDDDITFAGDWDGNGADSLGVRR